MFGLKLIERISSSISLRPAPGVLLMKHQLNIVSLRELSSGNTDAEHQIAEAPRFRNASALKLRGVNERQLTTQKGPLQEQ